MTKPVFSFEKYRLKVIVSIFPRSAESLAGPLRRGHPTRRPIVEAAGRLTLTFKHVQPWQSFSNRDTSFPAYRVDIEPYPFNQLCQSFQPVSLMILFRTLLKIDAMTMVVFCFETGGSKSSYQYFPVRRSLLQGRLGEATQSAVPA
jgi:hypothetical protein